MERSVGYDKRKKAYYDVRTLDNVTGILISMRYDIMQREKEKKE
jgi:hypothetical protein